MINVNPTAIENSQKVSIAWRQQKDVDSLRLSHIQKNLQQTTLKTIMQTDGKSLQMKVYNY